MKTGITFTLLILSCFYLSAQAQKAPKKITITGVVKTADLKPVAGAMIIIDNKKTNVVTDQRGSYKVRVSPDAKLISIFAMSLGIVDQEINGRLKIDITYNSPVSTNVKGGSEEKINVGYGEMEKKDMTMSVGKIDATNKKYASYSNIYDMIRGELPGVQVTGKSIRIQGPTSINLGTDPLLVVDGMVVSSIDDIRPQSVKSIEVLKGPSASIYGSRGANGVILITLIGAEKKK